MEMQTKTIITLALTTDEFKLIGRALSGVLKGKELQQARDLNVRMLEARNRLMLDEAEVIDGALVRARESLTSLPKEDGR